MKLTVNLKKKTKKIKISKNPSQLNFAKPKENQTSNVREKLSKREIIKKSGDSSKNTTRITKFSTPTDTNTRKKRVSRSVKKSIKKKIIVDLPPPWHDNDPKRIGSNQRDEMLYEQKNVHAWVKSELLPMFLKYCGKYLDICDGLKSRNERYLCRTVQCPFIQPLNRCKNVNVFKHPRSFLTLPDVGIAVVASCTVSAIIELSGYNEDKILYNNVYDCGSTLFDIAIHSFSGSLIGLDNQWNLLLIEFGKVIFRRRLELTNLIPKSPKFVFFDSVGLVWVNLLSQEGNLLCFDPLTLTPTLQINREQLLQLNENFRYLISLIPVSYSNRPLGFAVIFHEINEVYIYTSDFSKGKKLMIPEFSSIPIVKQIGRRLIAYAIDSEFSVFDLNDKLELITLAGKFKVDGVPIDVTYTDFPDLIYVATDDQILHTFLGHSTDFSLRIPESKLTADEKKSANKILGPPKITQSRKAFKEMRCGRFSAVPCFIDAMSLSENSAIVLAVSNFGYFFSCFIINDVQEVAAQNFDTFEYYEPRLSRRKLLSEFNKSFSIILDMRSRFLQQLKFLETFDNVSNKGVMTNMFNRKKEKVFVLYDLSVSRNIRPLFPFIPDSDNNNNISAYIAFHFLYRSGVLPDILLDFNNFLQRNAPENMRIEVNEPNSLINHLLPVTTTGVYDSIVDLVFTKAQLCEMIEIMDPFKCLDQITDRFTLEKALKRDETSVSTKWFSKYEIIDHEKRINKLSSLENDIKNETMSRILTDVEKIFYANLYENMIPVPPLDTKHVKKDEDNLKLENKSNRNPMIDYLHHKNILESWSKYTMYNKERGAKQIIHEAHIPRLLFTEAVKDHVNHVKTISYTSNKRISQTIIAVKDLQKDNVCIAMSEDSLGSSLNYFITLNSFLGADQNLICVCRTICAISLSFLHVLHQNNIICRVFTPSNIYLSLSQPYVTINTLIDSQIVNKKGIPLPPNFIDPSNPFLPPEFYHVPPEQYTTAWDIWQFGITLLYILTGFMPRSYGSILMEHVKEEHGSLIMNPSDPFSPTRIYPKVKFFYDWLNGIKLVHGDEKFQGERGECFVQTELQNKNATILDIQKYKLLPYANTRLNCDETKTILGIISLCLQIDPAKRPTAESLCRTVMFSQSAVSLTALEQYIRSLNSNIFFSHFLQPVFETLNESTFHFAIGTLSALIFHHEDDKDDDEFSFPLDNKSNEKVVSNVFNSKIIDKLVDFVLKLIESNIRVADVVPTVTYNNECMNKLVHFFMRFIASVEHGRGPLLEYIDDVITCLIALYSGNILLRYQSIHLAMSEIEFSRYMRCDSAPLSIYVHTKLHGVIKYCLTNSNYIYTHLKMHSEFDEWYINHLMSFSESVHNLSRTLCISIDKQKGNSIKLISALWSSESNPSVVRIFLYFKIPHKVLHCLHHQGDKMESLTFISTIVKSCIKRVYHPLYKLMMRVFLSPIVLENLAYFMRACSSNNNVRSTVFEIIKDLCMYPTISSTLCFTYSNMLWSLFENLREDNILFVIDVIVKQGNIFFTRIILNNSNAYRALTERKINILEPYESSSVNYTLDINDCIRLIRSFSNDFYIRNNKPTHVNLTTQPPIKETITLFQKTISLILAESELVVKFSDTQNLREAQIDLKETTFLKSKNKAKELSVAQNMCQIMVLCHGLTDLFVNFSKYIKDVEYAKQIYNVITVLAMTEIPIARMIMHPSINILQTSYCLLFLGISSNASKVMNDIFSSAAPLFPAILKKEYEFINRCADKNIHDIQVLSYYNQFKAIRFNMFKNVLLNPNIDSKPLIKYVVSEMLHDTTYIKSNFTFEVNQEMKFPIRSEAISMLKFILLEFETYKTQAKEIIEIFQQSEFLEGERKLLHVNDNLYLVYTSIELIDMILNCELVSDEYFLNSITDFVNSLKAQYIREFDIKKLQKGSTVNRIGIEETLNLTDTSKRINTSRTKKSLIITAPKLTTKSALSSVRVPGSSRRPATAQLPKIGTITYE